MKRLSDEQVSLVARRARALGDPTRVRILDVLGRSEQAVGRIAAVLDSQPSTASRHLQVLYQAGLVQRRREAITVIYSLAEPDILEWCRYFGATRLSARTSKG